MEIERTFRDSRAPREERGKRADNNSLLDEDRARIT